MPSIPFRELASTPASTDKSILDTNPIVRRRYPLSEVEQIVVGSDEADQQSEPEGEDLQDDESSHGDGDTAA